MNITKFFCVAALVFGCFVTAPAQKTDDILATATGHTFRFSDLSAATQKDAAELPAKIPNARIKLLEQLVSRRVFDAEAKSCGITMGKLIAVEKAKVKDPSDAEIKAVLDANENSLGGLPQEEARKQVIAYLRRSPEQKELNDLFEQLKSKFKLTPGKGVNAPKLAPTDIVATVNGKPVTGKEFEDFVKIPLYEARADLADVILTELDEAIYNALVADEARSLDIDAGALIAREVTGKMKEFSDSERFLLEDAFRTRLYTKYQVKILYQAPLAPTQRISVDDDPSTGSAAAPVTIVMFSDFQCSACSLTHPVLKKAMAQFPGKIRFVVRDFPLESIHENAWRAALAAGAANKQGKFFEYAEILYKHQNALDGESLKKYAAEVGLNVQRFEIDFNSEAVAAEVRKDMDDGESYAINSTPTIFVNGVRVRDLSPSGFKAAIEKALGK